MPFLSQPTDLVIGEKYLTWGGLKLTVTGLSRGKVEWRSSDGDNGVTAFSGFASRVRKALPLTPSK